MTKKDIVDFENSIKCWICHKVYVDGDIPIGNVKNWCLTFLMMESMCFIIKTYNFI